LPLLDVATRLIGFWRVRGGGFGTELSSVVGCVKPIEVPFGGVVRF